MSDSEKQDVAVRPRFGTVAVALGYITPEQLKEALSTQTDDNLADRPHRPIGSILYDKGFMSAHQLETVLDKTLEVMRTKRIKRPGKPDLRF